MAPTGPRRAAAGTTRSVNLERRAEIGAERRARSRNAILVAACRLYGTQAGQATRIEDICGEAGIARGTFYNHFTDLEQLRHELLDELTREFDRAVHLTFDQLEGPVEQTSVAVRYYLHAAAKNPEWGWAMVNTGTPGHIFGKTVWQNSYLTLKDAIDAGAFRLRDAATGRDILMGTISAATVSILRGDMSEGYPEEIAEHILMSFGLGDCAAEVVSRPLPVLPAIAHEIIVIANMPALGDIGRA
ncbi:TetR/AcrR family transcriptional regulator [Pseudogemmobacter bohemicus]|uniref:TetR/AcrR family transcriptional regulator n=1 Tax=Pseudogemmobacter bohemicus TaxID=2250708 RepID=UPI000DD32514|nr:TetR/AcrR family transcriptional regulator [Pseudogemmobacter bohemicus]